MQPASPPIKIATLKSPAAFRAACDTLGAAIPCDDALHQPSPLAQPWPTPINGKHLGNRIAIHPMEGWDGTATGGATPEMQRRWQRFGESGAKLICGGEAMAVRPDGRANPRQLILSPENQSAIAGLVHTLHSAHQARYHRTDDLLVGFQLTHSGRFCRPHGKSFEPRIAYRHPILDRKFSITSNDAILTDDELPILVQDFVRAARIAHLAGADFVDIKHCHGYLLHEFLSAHTRPGPYGGSFENRTRLLREIIAGIRADGNPIAFAVRLSCFDRVPFKPDPSTATPGKLGHGIPEDHAHLLPYHFGFGVDPADPTQLDLTEPLRFIQLCADLGVSILNTTAGSPYYVPHIQRPAAFPPSDGYQPPNDPLIDVARQMAIVRDIKQRVPSSMLIVGSGYTYLQDFLPHVAQSVIATGWADAVGLGRMALSYPTILTDAIAGRPIERKFICRTFSECTTAPRNGMISGCFPLDPYYTARPENARLKALKKATTTV